VFIVTLFAPGGVTDVAQEFKSSLESKGWSQNFKTEQGGESFATYERDESGITVNVANTDIEGYSRIDLTVTNAG
jgi:hypothetical protein